MTIPSTASPPSPKPGVSPIVLSCSSSSLLPQSRPYSLQRRAINPPPRRLVFEPVTIHPCGKQRQDVDGGKDVFVEVSSQGSFIESTRAIQHRRPPPPNALGALPLATPPNDGSALRGVVYMLHGWAQNVHVFSNRARKLTKRLNKARYRVVFLQGPHRLPSLEGSCSEVPDHPPSSTSRSTCFSREYAYAWFLYDDPGNPSASRRSEPAVLGPSPTGDFWGMDASLAHLERELRVDRKGFRDESPASLADAKATAPAKAPPFFLLGFSQGAVLVHKVATLACGSDGVGAAPGCDPGASFWYRAGIQKCILISGFSFTTSINVAPWVNLNTEDGCGNSNGERKTKAFPCSAITPKRTMPSFHVLGRQDTRVSPYLSLELHSLEPCFGGGRDETSYKVLWEHGRGHILPTNREFCDRLLGFLATP